MNDDPKPSGMFDDRQESLVFLALLSLLGGALSGLVVAIFRLSLEEADRLCGLLVTWT